MGRPAANREGVVWWINIVSGLYRNLSGLQMCCFFEPQYWFTESQI